MFLGIAKIDVPTMEVDESGDEEEEKKGGLLKAEKEVEVEKEGEKEAEESAEKESTAQEVFIDDCMHLWLRLSSLSYFSLS
jgi:hypothetical protein